MSDRTPTLQLLLEVLKPLEKWFVFGVKLGVPVSELRNIESSYSQRELERCKIDMLHYWLDNNVHPLWNDVVKALEQSDKRALAAQIKHDYLCSAAVSEEATTGMIAVARRRDTDVEEREERISHLEKELEELRRGEVESGEREDLLTREIEDLKSKLDKLSSHLIDKVDKIEAQLENREDTIANLGKESSQTELVLEKGDVRVMADACALPGRVAAIDFGTGSCSLAFTLAKNDEIAIIPLSNNPHSFDSARVPTAILLKKNPDGTLNIANFGSHAQDEISQLYGEELKEYLYFECFKMDLFNKAEISRDMPIKSTDGTSYYLVEVIAFVLWYLRSKLVDHLSRSGVSADDFDWVITVPAIWKASGKQMMREAASLAGLLSNTPGINRLTQCGSSIKCPFEKNPHKLTLVAEPECAALYCQQLSNDRIAPYSDKPDSLSADRYMVCDLGAGTVDITAYNKHSEDNIEVTIPPTGNDSGGKEINQQFYHLLEQIVDDKDFYKFVNKPKGKKSCHQAIIASIVFHNFEKEKQQFGMEALDNPDQTLRITLHHKFVEFYSKKMIAQGVRKLSDRRITFDDDLLTLEIKYAKVKELFERVMNRAIDCIKNALTNIDSQVDIIFLVGGFGGCRYTCNALQKALRADGIYVHVVVPKLHTLAVSRGAVLYRRNPAIIRARRMNASYGINCSSPFDNKIHDEAYAYRDPDTGEKNCRDLFSVFVKKGQKVTMTDRFVTILTPYRQAIVRATFNFYTTTDINIKYTVDKRGRSNLSQIGSLTLDCPNPDKLDKKDRKMEVAMDFSSTEIKVQARALYLPGQPPVRTVLDFL